MILMLLVFYRSDCGARSCAFQSADSNTFQHSTGRDKLTMGWLPDLSREVWKKLKARVRVLANKRKKAMVWTFFQTSDDSGSPFRWNDSSPTIKISSVAAIEFVSCASSLHTRATVRKVVCSSNRMTSTLEWPRMTKRVRVAGPGKDHGVRKYSRVPRSIVYYSIDLLSPMTGPPCLRVLSLAPNRYTVA